MTDEDKIIARVTAISNEFSPRQVIFFDPYEDLTIIEPGLIRVTVRKK